MKKLYSWKSIVLSTILFVGLWSCSDTNDDAPEVEALQKNIVETAQATDALSSLVAALAKADEREGTDLIGTLSGEGLFTVFAPTNDAFAALLGGLEGFDSLEDFESDQEKALLANILTYHVVGAKALSTDLSDGQRLTTVQGEDVGIDLDGSVFLEDATDENAQVAQADVMASNGVVHVIDKVLVPQAVLDALNAEMPSEDLQTLTEIVVEAEVLSVLEAAVIKAGLAETLSSEGPFTVFAPTDDAFLALLDILGDNYMSLDDFDEEAEIDLLRDILLYHVIPDAKVEEGDLSEFSVGTALADNSIQVIASGDTFVLGDASDTKANIVDTDIQASNGVAHTIDKVLLPQSALDFVASLQLDNIVELAVANDDLSLLVEALQQADAGLVETLGSEGPFTVFAPTNAAFEDLLNALGDECNSLSDFDTESEKALLVKILTYHVVAGKAAFSTDLSDGQMIETLQGESVAISLGDGTVQIEDATDSDASVVIADVEASNGIVHVIDKVLLPQEVVNALEPSEELNIVETAQSVDDLSSLVEALIQADAGLVETLSADGPFTVFAPTNEAFENLLAQIPNCGSIDSFDTPKEKALLAKILTYHVVAGAAVASGDLTDHQTIETVQGESLTAILGDGVSIGDKTDTDANVALADVMASNGIVHVIDKVLLPQEVLDILNPPSH
ncbi:fasciclin domain-containing protein [Pricia sp. S334]|uniref:Fasciclin domain-containing protein n=1 Tax=Pricia mediterranea TaxID=3076079 RepID=A0ABU3L2B3_9FLAO|nr:fasciclin domain-containing protein [Pricia sp. S334]MDT7827552.1 fasciclin domain-containing protein [Pricia sp. S334]